MGYNECFHVSSTAYRSISGFWIQLNQIERCGPVSFLQCPHGVVDRPHDGCRAPPLGPKSSKDRLDTSRYQGAIRSLLIGIANRHGDHLVRIYVPKVETATDTAVLVCPTIDVEILMKHLTIGQHARLS